VKDYAILADPNRETAKAYGVVNKERGFANRWTFYIGKDGKILAIDKKINTDKAGSGVRREAEGTRNFREERF